MIFLKFEIGKQMFEDIVNLKQEIIINSKSTKGKKMFEATVSKKKIKWIFNFK